MLDTGSIRPLHRRDGPGRALPACLRSLGHPPLTWGRSLQLPSDEVRRRYIAALRNADAGDLDPLVAFVTACVLLDRDPRQYSYLVDARAATSSRRTRTGARMANTTRYGPTMGSRYPSIPVVADQCLDPRPPGCVIGRWHVEVVGDLVVAGVLTE